MLTLLVEGSAGADIRNDLLPRMLDLARRMGVRVEMKGNDTTFWVEPEDTAASVMDAYDRLYSSSRLVASWIVHAVPRGCAS